MKKFFSLVLALVMALSLTTVAWADAMPADDADGTTDNVINLTADFTLDTIFKVTTGNVTIKAATPVKITTALVDAIQVETGATLTLGENVTIESSKGAILYANGGTININGATLVSTTGATEALGFAANGGTINMNSGYVNAYWTGLTASGAGSKVNILGGTVESTNSNATLAKNYGTTTITGGTIKTGGNFVALWAKDNGVLVVNGGAAIAPVNGAAISLETSATATVSAGTFDGPVSVKAGTTLTITGGTFATDVSEYVDPAYVYVNGEVKKTTSVGNTTVVNATTLSVIDALGAEVDVSGITSIVKVAATTNKTTVDGKTTTTVVPAWYQLSDGTTSATFVECDKTSAEFMFTFKGVGSVYVRGMAVPAAFDATPVTLYTAPLKAACGVVGSDNDVFVVSNGKYYATEGVGVENYALVNGKMVVYYDEVLPKAHNWASATVESWSDKTYATATSVKCPDCKGVIKVYTVPGVFDGKTYLQIPTGVAAGYYYVAGATANTVTGTVVGTPSTDKVTSAETFDAGIAMYVGMSVLAATGSAVVLKKREG